MLRPALFALVVCSCGAPSAVLEDAGVLGDGALGDDAGALGDDAGALGDDAGPTSDAGLTNVVDANDIESVDEDRDGLDDEHELALATAYLPFLSNHPDDACPRSGIVFRARPHPLDASFVHVIYSRLYELDCGLTSHPGDNEVFSLTIDPTRAPPAGIVAVRAISHQSTICERDTSCGACPGLSPCDTGDVGGLAFPVVYASKDKHATVVDIGAGCSLTSCLDRCELAVTTTIVPLVNGGEPDHPLIDDLSDPAQGGFITAANGWTEESALHYDPWSGLEFGSAGIVRDDLMDDAFDTPTCR